MFDSREKRFSWDDTFMMMALSIAQRGADPNTQVGCCLVDSKNRLIGAGYNGPPRGISPITIPWEREGAPENTKYAYIIHAEQNAIHNTTVSLEGAKAYITLFCCNQCAMSLVQAGIKEVIYLNDKYKDTWSFQVAEKILKHVDVKVRKHKWSENFLSIFPNMISLV